MEVVFVSSDRSQADMNTYMRESHGDWLALAHGSPEVSSLSGMFGVRGIPALIVVTRDGEVISRDGRQDVMSLGASAFSTWNQVVPELSCFLTCQHCLMTGGSIASGHLHSVNAGR